MNSTEPQSPSTALSTTKIYPPLLAAALVLGTLVLHFILPEERTVGWYQVIGLLVVAQAPYTWTRNPMYLGLATALMGLAIFFGSIAMLLAPAVFFAVIDRMVIPREEETMERLFGNDYVDYKNRVRRWI